MVNIKRVHHITIHMWYSGLVVERHHMRYEVVGSSLSDCDCIKSLRCSNKYFLLFLNTYWSVLQNVTTSIDMLYNVFIKVCQNV